MVADEATVAGDSTGRWRPDVARLPALAPALQAALPVAVAAAQRATKPDLAKFLASLALLCAPGNISVTDAKAKLGAYADMLDGRVPASVLTRENLEAMARRFRFLPAYGELVDELDALSRPVLSRLSRIRALLGEPGADPLDEWFLAMARWEAGWREGPMPLLARPVAAA